MSEKKSRDPSYDQREGKADIAGSGPKDEAPSKEDGDSLRQHAGNGGIEPQDTADTPETEEMVVATANASEDNQAMDTAGEAGEEDVLLTLQAENEALKDKLLRAAAELENLRKRADREKAEAHQYAMTAFARDMLSVADNLMRAIAAMPAEERGSMGEAMRNLVAGVEMTERELLNIFERHGIKRFNPQDERFDPNYHQAMFEVDNPDVPAGTVIEVVQTGYAIADRILRPALVGVSKGGPKKTSGNGASSAQPETSGTNTNG